MNYLEELNRKLLTFKRYVPLDLDNAESFLEYLDYISDLLETIISGHNSLIDEMVKFKDELDDILKVVVDEYLKGMIDDGSLQIILQEIWGDEFNEWFNSVKEIVESIGDGEIQKIYDLQTEINNAKTNLRGKKYGSLKEIISIPYKSFTDEFTWGGIREPFVGFVSSFKNKMNQTLNRNNLSILVDTDMHAYFSHIEKPGWNYLLSYTHASVTNALEEIADVKICLGDNIHASYRSRENMLRDLREFSNKMMFTINENDKFMFMGNHDDGSDQITPTRRGSGLKPYDKLVGEDFKKHFFTNELLYGEVRDNGSLYFYKDYPEKNVRLIGLDSSDIPEYLLNTNGGIKYNRWHIHAYSDKQLNWLAHVALKNVPVGYDVIFFGHYLLNYAGGNLPQQITEVNPNNDTYINHNHLYGIIEAYRQGVSYVGNSPLKDFEASISVDFTEKRNVVGLISGHTHRESIYTINGLNVITLLNSLADRDRTEIVQNTDREDAKTVLEIDTQNKKLFMHGYGASTDRVINY